VCKKSTFYYCLFFFDKICVGLTSPGAGKGGGGGEGGGGRLPLREGGEVADALAPLMDRYPIYKKKVEKYVFFFTIIFPYHFSQLLFLQLV